MKTTTMFAQVAFMGVSFEDAMAWVEQALPWQCTDWDVVDSFSRDGETINAMNLELANFRMNFTMTPGFSAKAVFGENKWVEVSIESV